MKELKKINAAIAKKQIGRIVVGVGSVILGSVLIGKFMYQLGITDGQLAIYEVFPEEYMAITAKITQTFENA